MVREFYVKIWMSWCLWIKWWKKRILSSWWMMTIWEKSWLVFIGERFNCDSAVLSDLLNLIIVIWFDMFEYSIWRSFFTKMTMLWPWSDGYAQASLSADIESHLQCFHLLLCTVDLLDSFLLKLVCINHWNVDVWQRYSSESFPIVSNLTNLRHWSSA